MNTYLDRSYEIGPVRSKERGRGKVIISPHTEPNKPPDSFFLTVLWESGEPLSSIIGYSGTPNDPYFEKTEEIYPRLREQEIYALRPEPVRPDDQHWNRVLEPIAHAVGRAITHIAGMF